MSSVKLSLVDLIYWFFFKSFWVKHVLTARVTPGSRNCTPKSHRGSFMAIVSYSPTVLNADNKGWFWTQIFNSRKLLLLRFEAKTSKFQNVGKKKRTLRENLVYGTGIQVTRAGREPDSKFLSDGTHNPIFQGFCCLYSLVKLCKKPES